MSELMQLTRWTAESVAAMREDLGELRGRVTADIGELRWRMGQAERKLRTNPKPRAIWKYLGYLARVPWGLVIGTILLITGHATMGEWKAWIFPPAGH